MGRESFLGSSNDLWDRENLPVLKEYIKIPNKSPAYDAEWEAKGHMERAVKLYVAFAEGQKAYIPGLTVEVKRIPGRTPLILIQIPGTGLGRSLLYGHLDKQPEMTGWDEGKGPWTPVVEGEKLYGRGSTDDGYAMFAALGAYRLLAEKGVPYPSGVILIEASEESGSPDLPAYIDMFSDEIGTPETVICLDSGAGDYKSLWRSTSLRGVVTGTLRVKVLKEGVHSGDAGNVVPSSERILRQLLSRIENLENGEILLKALYAEIPPGRVKEAEESAEAMDLKSRFPLHDGVRTVQEDAVELLLARTWKPALTITGMDGLPSTQNAGNVIVPETAKQLSMRLPPTVDAKKAALVMKEALEKDPPHGAQVTFEIGHVADGWDSPELEPWLEESLGEASKRNFGNPLRLFGEGGSIPFMKMLQEKFPGVQFVVTGVGGPGSNAHGPNECLDIPTAKKITASVADILADQAAHV